MKRLFLSILLLLAVVAPGNATILYVSNAGSGSACTIGSPCTLATANATVAAGDTVYLRGGAYTVNVADNSGAIQPGVTGTAGNVITYSAYTAETPVLSPGTGTGIRAFYIQNRDYIKITGITFTDWRDFGQIEWGHYNEISYCIFNGPADGGVLPLYIYSSQYDGSQTHASTHNWLHHNTWHTSGVMGDAPGCNDTGQLIYVGMPAYDWSSGNNTIENNLMYSTGHALMETHSPYNVVRNNTFHNEGWQTKVGCTNGPGASGMYASRDYQVYDAYSPAGSGSTSATNLTVGTGTQTLTVATGLTLETNQVIVINSTDSNNHSGTMHGKLTTYDSGTGVLVVDIQTSNGNTTYNSWNVGFARPPSVGGGTFALVEGNRMGHAACPAANNGCENLTVTSLRNIVRYNGIYNAEGAGIYFKSGTSGASIGTDNRVYNNTVYKNAQYVGTRTDVQCCGMYFHSVDGINNVLKNNILYANTTGDFSSTSNNTFSNNWLNASGDPHFVNTSVADPTSLTLPDLNLTSSSTSLIDAGTYLTTTVGTGSNSTTLIVADALYFQAGSAAATTPMGASISSIAGDYIAIGTVSNTVQITDINYSTNTITLASGKTWSNGASVWLYKKSDGVQVLYGSAPDYGAHEYTGASSSSITIGTGGSITLGTGGSMTLQ